MTAALLLLALAVIVGAIHYAIFRPELAAFHADTLAEARARHGQHAKLRERRPAATASPEGTAPAPAAGAVPAAGWALAPVPSWARDGANPYPAETRTDLPAIAAVRPYALAPVRADCPSSPTGGHCCRNDGGKWICCLPGCPR